MKLMFVQVQAVKSTPKVQKYTYQKVDASSQEVGASSQGVDASSPGVLQCKHKYPRREGKTGSKSSNCSSSEEVDSAEKLKLRKTHRKAAHSMVRLT